jgi:hypothetical protein
LALIDQAEQFQKPHFSEAFPSSPKVMGLSSKSLRSAIEFPTLWGDDIKNAGFKNGFPVAAACENPKKSSNSAAAR